jgi:bifunctional non-homologous end joining protein LigD
MPLTWPQLRSDVDPRKFTLRSVPALLKKSKAWLGYDGAAASIKSAIGKMK